MQVSKAQISRIYQTLARNKWPIFLLWALWLTLEYFGLGPFSYVRIHDWGDSSFPMKLGLIREFFENGFSYWSNIAASGFDRIGATGPFFHVDSLFFLTLPPWLSYGLVTLLQRFLAGYFTYRLCNDYLKLDKLPSIVAGLVYSMSFFYFQSEFAGEAGFPLLLWALERVSTKRKLAGYILAFVLGLFALFSSNFALSVPFILPMALAWFVLVRRKYSFHFLSLFAIFTVTLLAGQITTVWSLLANASLSHRADWDLATLRGATWMGWVKYTFHFLIMPTFVVGIVGLYLSKLKERSLLMVMVLFGFCGIVAKLIHLLFRYFDIGFFSGFQFDRFYLLVPFFAALALAYGLHLLSPSWVLTQKDSHNKTKYRLQTILGIIVIGFIISLYFYQRADFFSDFPFGQFYFLAPFFAILVFAYIVHLVRPNLVLSKDSSHNKTRYRVQTMLGIMFICFLVLNSFSQKVSHGLEWVRDNASYAINYENPDLQHIAADTSSTPFRVGTIAHGLHPAYANAYGLETVDGYVVFYPQRYQDFWGKVIEPLSYNHFLDWGNRIYLFSPPNAVSGSTEEVPFGEYYNLNLLSLANTKYLISELPLSDENLMLLPSQIHETETTQQGGLSLESVLQSVKRNINGRRLYIYKNELCFPRFFLSGEVIAFEDQAQLLEAMAKADINSLRNKVFIEEEFASKINVEKLGFTHGEIAIEQYSPDQIVLAARLDKPGILVISNSYNPNWTCKVNGIDKGILAVYHTFTGVFLEEGENLVQLEYRPPYRAPW